MHLTWTTHTCTVLRVEYDLDPDALDDWHFTPRAIDDCKHLNTTPVAVVDSIDDAQPYPAASMCTIYRNRLYDILTNEPKHTILTIKPSGTLTTTSTHDTRRTTGGTPTGTIPNTTTELLNRARRLAPLAELVTTPFRSLQPSLTLPLNTPHSFLLPGGKPKKPTSRHQQGRDPAPLLSVGDSGSRRASCRLPEWVG